MLQRLKKSFEIFIQGQKEKLSNYSFGAISAVITSLALITNLDVGESSKLDLIRCLCIIAFADNISDSLSMHIHQESIFSSFRKVWGMTLANFFARMLVITVFIGFIACLPPILAIVSSILYGFLILIAISFLVARKRSIRPGRLILEHILIATVVLILSKYIAYLIQLRF